MSVIVRTEREGDIQSIREINLQAFGQQDEVILIDKLRETTLILSLVAENEGGQLIGHIMFSRIKIGSYSAVSLAPMAVLPSYQGMGVGKRLIRDGIRHLKNMGEELIMVLGHSEYYPRFGFEAAFHYGIFPPFELTNKDAWMLYYLDTSIIGKIKGRVVYPPAFNEL